MFGSGDVAVVCEEKEEKEQNSNGASNNGKTNSNRKIGLLRENEVGFENKSETEVDYGCDSYCRGLSEEDKELLGRLVVTPKMLQLLGDERLLPRKARCFFGENGGLEPIEKRQRVLQHKAQVQEVTRRKVENKKTLLQILKQKPTEQQRKLPAHNDRHISPKALRLLGDEYLNQQSLNVMTPAMRKNVNAKTLNLFGEPSTMLTPKQQQILGVQNFPSKNSSWVAQLKERFGIRHFRIPVLL